MKTVDKAFVLGLIVLPFAVAVFLAFQLVQNPSVSPDETDARGTDPTPTFAVLPISASPTPTFQDQPITPTATPTFEIPDNEAPDITVAGPGPNSPTATVVTTPAEVTIQPSVSATPSPTAEPEPTVLAELPDTDMPEVEQDLTNIGILVVSLTVATVTGGLLMLGSVLRKRSLQK